MQALKNVSTYNLIREIIFSFQNDYVAMKSFNMSLVNVNSHYITSKVTLFNKYKLKLLLEMLMIS